MKIPSEILNKLTPVEKAGFLWVKRDDMFTPFGKGSINGGKLRQAMWLMSQSEITGVVSGGSLHSPQSPIVAGVAKYLNIPCIILYGNTTMEKVLEMPMSNLAHRFGARIDIVANARHNYLFAQAKRIADEKGYFLVEFGMNSKEPDLFEAFYQSNANQVQNIPDDVDTIVCTCGSGITATGILKGIEMYQKNIKSLYLVGTAPNRLDSIIDRCDKLKVEIKPVIYYIDLFNEAGFTYEKNEHATLRMYENREIILHPNYEAKTYNWMRHNVKNIIDGKTLLWIVGSKPTI